MAKPQMHPVIMPDASPNPSAGSGSGGQDNGPSDASAMSFQVTIDDAVNVHCPSECTQLTASAAHGRAPFSYAWTHGLGSDPSVTVCPTQTTTYTVTAKQAADGSSEFGGLDPSATANVTVRVVGSCADAGMPEGEPDAGPSGQTSMRTLCSRRWTLQQSFGANPELIGKGTTTDAAGNIVIAGSLSGAVDFGMGLRPSEGQADGFVVKLDPSCKVLWVRTFGAADALLSMGPVATDSAGNIVVTGSFSGAVDFGKGALAAANSHAQLMLVKLDPAGHTLWSKQFGSSYIPIGGTTIATDLQNNIVLGGYAGYDTNFGTGPLSLFPDGLYTFVARFDASGVGLASRAFFGSAGILDLAVDKSGRTGLACWTRGPLNGSDGTVIAPTNSNGGWYVFAAKFDTADQLQWHTIVEEHPDDMLGWWIGGIAVDSASNFMVTHGALDTTQGDVLGMPSTNALWFVQAGNQAGPAYSATVQAQRLGYGASAIDAADNLIYAGDFGGALKLDTTTLASSGRSDVFVRKLDHQGRELWAVSLGTPADDEPWGLAADPQGDVIVTYWTEGETSSAALEVVKLAR